MIFVALSALCSVLLGFIFKMYGRFGVDTFQAIIFNYATCFLCGWVHLGHFPVSAETLAAPWLPYALVLGVIFISGFNAAGLTVRYFGVTVSQIMQKMSILMTVPFAIMAYQESSGMAKIVGFLMALGAIVLVNWPSPTDKKNQTPRKSGWWLAIPLLTWFLSGILEVILVRVQKEGLSNPEDPAFLIHVFGTAGVLGFSLAVAGWWSSKLRFNWKNVLGGIILGIPNYGSMYFLLMALDSGLEGSFVFSVTNVSIILATTFGAVWLFREHLNKINWLGIAFAVAAIALISM
jgi:drug/metabolite transporter (DMT)-like permease